MKKFILRALTAALTVVMSVNAFASPKVSINGEITDTAAIIKDSRTLVGVRGVFENLGYSVEWNGDTSTATLTNSENTIVLQNGLDYFTVNGNKITPDVPQQIIDSRFYLPLRAVGEAIGAEVDWDKDSETAIINGVEVNNMNNSSVITEETIEQTSVIAEEVIEQTSVIAEEVIEQTSVIAEETVEQTSAAEQTNTAQPGLRTIRNLLLTALEPVGTTMYIYGGGWNEEDTGAGIDAVTIGLSPTWEEFYSKQNSSYNHNNYNYKKDVSVIYLGLDCSGYIGWTIYNTLFDESNLGGFVMSSKKMASNFAERGWGNLASRGTFTDYQAGDILSASCSDCAHVWLCVGQCDDGSVVFMHSSPPGVQISGTYTRDGNKNSQAIALASQYMKKYFSQWYEKYPDVSRNASYLSHYDRFRWSENVELADPDGLRSMGAEEVLRNLFGE